MHGLTFSLSQNGTKKAKEIIVESSDPINTAEIETEVRALSSSSSSTSTNGPQNHQNQSLSRLRRTSGDRKQLDTRHTNEGVVHLKLNQSQSHDRSVPTVPVGESRSLTTNSQISAPSPLNVTSNATHPPPPPPVIKSSVPTVSISKPQQPADAGRRDLFSAINSLRKKDG